MATQRQKKVAKLIVANVTLDKPLNAGEMLEKVGYSKSVAGAKSKDILESEGVKNALAELGFSEDRAKEVVGRILVEGEENNQLKAADMIFKSFGTYAAEKRINVNLEIETNPALKELANDILERQRHQ